MINGFYGAHNSGDEAMLRNFVYNMQAHDPECITLVATDKAQSFNYKNVYFVSSEDRAQLTETDAFILGGGDLTPAFGNQLLLHAKKVGNKCIMLGASINDDWLYEKMRDIYVKSLELFDLIFVRDLQSKENLDKLGIKCSVKTDISVGLPSVPIEFKKSDKHVTLCIREVHPEYEVRMVALANKVVRFLLKEGFTITLLPLCYEDKRSYEYFTKIDPKIEMIYTLSPQQHKYVIGNSDYVISLGRLHPLIYAIDTVTPMLGVVYPILETPRYHKMPAWFEYINNDYLLNFNLKMKDFEKKFRELNDHKDEVKKQLVIQKKSHDKCNKEQFNELINFIKGKNDNT